MAEMIFVDENGNELSREPKGRGRPPRGAEKQADGNFIVKPATDERFHPEYIDFDDNGNVTSRSPKGRGRSKPGYVKQKEGEYEGHWLKAEVEETEVEETEAASAPVVTDASGVTTVSAEAHTEVQSEA